MTAIRVTITDGKPDHVEVDGEHVPHAEFEYRYDVKDRRRLVFVTCVDGAEGTRRWFPLASGTFEGETHP